jgi:hypothetical protein
MRVLRPVAAGILAVVAGAMAGAVPAAAASREPGPAPAAPLPAAAPVLLINGTQLLVRPAPGGASAVAVLPGTARGGLISLREPAGATEEIPAEDLPYLGHGLDPSLFNLSALQRAEAGGQLPVRVTFAGSRPQLPGITITSSGPGTAAGYLTVAGAQVFGAALRSESIATPASVSPLLGAGTDIALAGATAEPAGRPDSRTHTLTVTATNLASKPDNGGIAWVFDGSNLTAFAGISPFKNGVVRFSVPTGQYWVIGEFDTDTTTSGITRVDILPEVTVGADTTVHVAATAATSEVTMATPRPASAQAVGFSAIIGDSRGSTAGLEWYDAPGAVWVSPMTRQPSAGTLQAGALGVLTSLSGAAGAPYVYNLDYADAPGVVPAQHYQVQPSGLAAVTERYYQDASSSGAWLNFGAFPDQPVVSWIFAPLALPGTQVQYFSTGPQLIWNTQYYTQSSGSGFPSGGQSDDAWRVLAPGPQTQDWNDYPLHPQPQVSAGGLGGSLFPLVPSAIRTGNTLTLTMRPFSDNQPGHLGNALASAQTSSYQVDQDGVPVAHGSAGNGIPPVTLSAKPSLVSFTLNSARTGALNRLSASTQTTWAWRSSPDPGATVTSSWYCSATKSGQLLRHCAVQPLLTLDYQVYGLALSGTAPAGVQLIGLHAGHLQLAPTARITSAIAQVSCDDGKSWRRAAVRGQGGGNFLVGFTAPRGCMVTLRVGASDAAGGSIAETIVHAYQVAG